MRLDALSTRRALLRDIQAQQMQLLLICLNNGTLPSEAIAASISSLECSPVGSSGSPRHQFTLVEENFSRTATPGTIFYGPLVILQIRRARGIRVDVIHGEEPQSVGARETKSSSICTAWEANQISGGYYFTNTRYLICSKCIIQRILHEI